ncbi:MAG TPA: DOMON-like domain-containing protein [Steroidobacteraceae bacterium]
MDVAIARDAAGGLGISFRIAGEIGRLRLPGAAPPLRADGLWQHGCFEAFLRADGADCYHEFNFSPSGAWAAYRFTGRRTGRSSPVMTAPTLQAERLANSFGLSAILLLAELPDLARAATIHSGLAAILEDGHGALSYWALAHGSPQPDFHDPASFTLALPAA